MHEGTFLGQKSAPYNPTDFKLRNLNNSELKKNQRQALLH